MNSFLITLFSMIGLFAAAQINLSNNLIACYPLNGDGTEVVGNLTATLSAVTPTTGHFGPVNTACHFSGNSNCYISLPEGSVFKPKDFTFSAWIKADTLQPEMTILYARNTSTTTDYTAYYALTIKYYNAAYRFGVLRQNDYTGYYPSSTTTLTTNTWYHVAFTLSSNTMSVFVNGTYESDLITPQSFTYNPSKNVFLGGKNENPSAFFRGDIDNVRFYSRVLSPSEINVLYYQDPSCGAISSTLHESLSEIKFKVYPNPTIGKLHLLNLPEEPFTYEIVDLSGLKILCGKTEKEVKNEIDLSKFASGIYFLRLYNKEYNTTIKLLKE